ncbi:MAG: hypothetical protein ACREOO_15035 [bacterium]
MKYLSPKKWLQVLLGSRLANWVESPFWFRAFVAGLAACGSVYALNWTIAEIHPYSIWGLTYGTLAAILMAGAGMLGVRRRMNRMALRLRLGQAQPWLQFHIYGGMLAALLMFMHTGFRVPHGVLTWWLWFSTIIVTASGILGVFLQKWIPKILSSGLAIEVLYERIPELIVELREKANELMQTCAEPVREFYRKEVAIVLVRPQPRFIYYLDITGGIHSRIKQFDYLRGLLPVQEKEKLDRLQSFYKTKLEIDAHYTLQRTLRWWLFLHVPLSLVVLVLMMIHLLSVWYY